MTVPELRLTTFSILTPVYNTPADVLRACIDSVRGQHYERWELCLVDDGSSAPHVRSVLDRAARRDPRIRVSHRREQGGIVAASNDALAMATGEFVVLLDHDDLLHTSALEELDFAITDEPETDYLYSDEDKVDVEGRHFGPFLKPGWSPERLRTQMYTCHVSAMRRTLAVEVGGFDPAYEGAQDWDLVFRVTERARQVRHVPHLLYSWRTLPTSVAALGPEAKPYAYEAATRAIEAHCNRIGFQATVSHATHPKKVGVYHLTPSLRSTPLVSIVIPTAGTWRDVRSTPTQLITHSVRNILDVSTYPALEIVVVADPTLDAAARTELTSMGGDRLRIVDYDRPFSFSEKINLGVLHSRGEHLLLLNDDIEIVTPDWIERLVMYSSHEPIGVVGARLLYEDGRVQHAGLAAQRSCVGHMYHGFPPDAAGYVNSILVAGNHLAVTGACIMTRRAVFDEVGGMSPLFPLNYNDVDYCLKVWHTGRRVAYDPDTVLIHFESSSRTTEVSAEELQLLRDRWHHEIETDRHYPPGLDTHSVDNVPPPLRADGVLLVEPKQ